MHSKSASHPANQSSSPQASQGYSGDVTASQAWQKLRDDKDAVLVDVRTAAELAFVGRPDLSSAGKRLLAVEWERFPGRVPNAEFANNLKAAGARPEQAIYFLCRSGGRSRSAAKAMTVLGFRNCFNIIGGFEGDLDAAGHRGRGSCWKTDGLPWVQE